MWTSHVAFIRYELTGTGVIGAGVALLALFPPSLRLLPWAPCPQSSAASVSVGPAPPRGPHALPRILSCLLSYPAVDPAGTFQQAPIPVFPSLGVVCTCVGLTRWNRTSARTLGLPPSHVRGFQGAAGVVWTVLHLRVDWTGWRSRAGSLCAIAPPEALGPFCFCVLPTEPGRAGNACVYSVWFRGGPAQAWGAG